MIKIWIHVWGDKGVLKRALRQKEKPKVTLDLGPKKQERWRRILIKWGLLQEEMAWEMTDVRSSILNVLSACYR